MARTTHAQISDGARSDTLHQARQSEVDSIRARALDAHRTAPPRLVEAQLPDSAYLDTWNRSRRAKADSARSNVKDLLHAAKADLLVKDPWKQMRTTGTVEAGGIYGALPYSTAGLNDMNAFGKGQVGFSLAKVPLQVHFDVGTDVPLRGQRNSIRLSLDKERLLHGTRLQEAVSLSMQQQALDSLQALRAEHYRSWRGALFRMHELKPTFPLDTLRAPATPQVATALPDTNDLRPDMRMAPAVPSLSLDSLQGVASHDYTELLHLDAQISDAQRDLERGKALVNAAQGKEGLLRGLLNGVDHLDIGTCTPASSEFLLNGITFQGVSFAYAQHDIYFSFDRGRSFDDTWMATDRVRTQLDALQRSLFLADTRDLAQRSITAVRAGFGAPDHSHFHVGYLYGERSDVPQGYDGSAAIFDEAHNHVVEADMGYEVKPGHLVRAVVARSVTLSGSSEGETANASVGDLLARTGGQNTAAKVMWSSRFERAALAVDLEGRTIQPYFQSYGLGFVRSGSKAAEAKLSRSFGRKWKVRGRYVLEQRTPPGDAQGTMDLQRAQVQVNYRPTRALTLRAMYLPLVTRVTEPGLVPVIGHTTSSSIGGDLDRRWGDLAVVFSADVGTYIWYNGSTPQQQALNYSIGSTIRAGDRLQVRVLWSALASAGDSLTTRVGNASLWGLYRVKDRYEVEVGMQVPQGAPTGWSLGVLHNLTRSLRLAIRAKSYSRSELLFQDPVPNGASSTYTWSCSLMYSW